MTVSHTKSPEHAEPLPPMSTKVDVDIAYRTGRTGAALDALLQNPAVVLTALLVLTGVLLKRKRPADAHRRRLITSEYLEQPGLRLTIPQASRLWGLPPSTCSRLLEKLIDRGFLKRTSEGAYCRRDVCTPTSPVTWAC
jgi:IclR-like helix-turn-helix domain-containing protein